MSEFNKFIDLNAPYKLMSGPNVVKNLEDAQELGMNCIALAHFVLEDMFGQRLPEHMRCYETFTNTNKFELVDGIESSQAGDLVWFGLESPKISVEEFVPDYQDQELANWQDFPVKHVGIITGEHEGNEPLILHTTFYARGSVEWPLSKFKQYPKYARIYAIQRLKNPTTDLTNQAPEPGQLINPIYRSA